MAIHIAYFYVLISKQNVNSYVDQKKKKAWYYDSLKFPCIRCL